MNKENARTVSALKFTWRGKVFEMSINRNPLRDAELPKPKARVIPFSTALLVEILMLVGLWMLGILIPPSFNAAKQLLVIPLVRPRTVDASQPRPIKAPRVAPAHSQPLLAEEVVPPKPALPDPVTVAPLVKTARHSNAAFPDNDMVNSPPPPAPDLSLGSSAIPELKKPRPDIQTGGFGDPDGAHTNGKTNRTANIAEFGMYDLPSGAGLGNGLGGSKGVSGVISSAGFGNGVAAGTKTKGRGVIQQGLFAEGQVTASPPKSKNAAPDSPRSTPVEILSKPKPTYTDSARAKKIEGEVLVEVTFLATGQVQVLRVSQGLGEGLDEAAVAAARQIRFRPATLDGKPVDSTAIVHILFQLAY